MEAIFGVKDHVTLAQECARAALIFAYGLAMLRLSGKRTFSQWSALDVVLSIVVGSCLSRALTGSAPLIGTLAAVAVLVALHAASAYASARFVIVSKVLEGSSVTLVRNGALDESARLRHMVSLGDLAQALRENKLKGLDEITKVKELRLEPNGKFTMLKE